MGTAKNLLNRLKAVDVNRIAIQSIADTEENYADLNAEQMSMGLRADGKEITPVYAPITIAIKRATGVGIGKITSHVTLFNKGGHYRGIKTRLVNDTVVTDSSDWKSGKLEEKYGDIYGLSKGYKQEYVEEFLRPEWKTEIENATGLKLR